MTKKSLHEPFSVEHTTREEGHIQGHKHNFFELVFIVSGTGAQCINGSRHHYMPNHMFLITPEDCHSLEVTTTTTFFFLRFNNIYLKQGGLPKENIERLEFILQNANHRPGCILKNQTDKLLVRPMVEAIVREYANRDLYNNELIKQMVNTLIIVVARNIAKYQQLYITEQTEDKAIDILHYLQRHIYDPSKLRAEHISQEFNIAPAYLSRYFKHHTGETMQQYIAGYKTKLIQHRLQYSDKRINEIAEEFNFTDESHLNKFFKNQAGVSPKEYRRQLKMKMGSLP
jgi:AraC-like DNA-binding protein